MRFVRGALRELMCVDSDRETGVDVVWRFAEATRDGCNLQVNAAVLRVGAVHNIVSSGVNQLGYDVVDNSIEAVRGSGA